VKPKLNCAFLILIFYSIKRLYIVKWIDTGRQIEAFSYTSINNMLILLELLLDRKPVHAEEHMKPSSKAMKLNKSSNSGYLPSLILEQSFKGCTKEQTRIAMSNYDFVKRKNTSS
jgi:hypothetical protein